MTICQDCKQEMTDANTVTCNDTTVIFPDGKIIQRIPYAEFIQGIHTAARCHDCNIEYGGYHHLGCDMEICPSCGGQLISCGCLDTEKDLRDAFKSVLSKTRSDEEISQLMIRMTAQDMKNFLDHSLVENVKAATDLLNEVIARPVLH